MATNLHLPPTMILPPDFEAEILPFIDESQPTTKEAVIVRILEHQWERRNIRAVLNYLFSLPCVLFFKDGDRVRFC